MTYATAEDVLSRWVGNGKPADTEQVELYVADAETLIASEFPDLADRVEDGTPSEDAVKLVVVAMVTRVYKNPEGIRSRNDSTSDQFGGTVVYSGDNPGTLDLTAAERNLLAGDANRFGGLGVISTTRGPIETASVITESSVAEEVTW